MNTNLTLGFKISTVFQKKEMINYETGEQQPVKNLLKILVIIIYFKTLAIVEYN